jgi:hypothetical protein
MKYLLVLVISVVLIIQNQFPSTAQQNSWTHFRGNNLDGLSKASDVPTVWNDSLNITWKTKITGKGWSSPVIFGDQGWLTTATEDGKIMYALCVDIKTGKEIYNIKLFEPTSKLEKHDINTYATPTPSGGHRHLCALSAERGWPSAPRACPGTRERRPALAGRRSPQLARRASRDGSVHQSSKLPSAPAS